MTATAPAEADAGGQVVQAPPWPPTAEPSPPAGFSWQTVHHETLHVRLPVPAGWRVDKARGPYRHPIIRLWEEGRDAAVGLPFQFVDVTFSAGTGPGELGLLAKKPAYYGLSVERAGHTSETIVVDTHNVDGHVVHGYARGLRCEATRIRSDAFADQAFRICGAFRAAAPGVWRRDPTLPIAIPDGAHVRRDGPTIYLGPFVVFVRPRQDVPDTFAWLRRREVDEVTVDVDRRPLAAGVAYVRWATREYLGTKYPGDVAVFLSRAGWDCRAVFPAFAARAPAPAEIDFAIALCDTLPAARGPDPR